MKEIEELRLSENTIIKDGRDYKTLPDSTPENLEKIRDKMNEIIDAINALSIKS